MEKGRKYTRKLKDVEKAEFGRRIISKAIRGIGKIIGLTHEEARQILLNNVEKGNNKGICYFEKLLNQRLRGGRKEGKRNHYMQYNVRQTMLLKQQYL